MGLRRRKPRPVRWSDLPDDLLPVVYGKIGSLLHRVRFAAVCRSWRAAAVTSRHAAPPVLPLLILSSDKGDTLRAYCPEEGGILRIRPRTPAITRRQLVGAHDGGWVAAIEDDTLNLVIVNPLSGKEVSFAARDLRTLSYDMGHIYKVVFSEPPTSSSCILAAVTTRHNLALCRIGCPHDKWTVKQMDGFWFMGIVFCNGHLYGITFEEQLVKFEIGVNKDGGPVFITEPRQLQVRKHGGPPPFRRYIIDLHGKLVMVVRINSARINCEPIFNVFELVYKSTTEYTYQWKKLKSLGDYALFIGATSSKAVYVSSSRSGGVQRNCIYANNMAYLTSLDGRGERVYPVQDKCRIKSAGSYVAVGGDIRAMWVFPSNF